MDALIDEIITRTGLTRAQAEEAAKTTINFLKDRLPSSVASQIDGALVGAQAERTAEQIGGKIEGLFR